MSVELTNEEIEIIEESLFVVGNAMQRNPDEPENSSFAYSDNQSFAYCMSASQYQILCSALQKMGIKGAKK